MSSSYNDVGEEGEGFSQQQQRAILQVAQACASLSFIGSAAIIVAYFRFKQLRTYSFQLVVWLAVCDIITNLSFFLGNPDNGSSLCNTQAIIHQFFQVALIQWTLLISRSLLALASKKRKFDGRKRMPWNHLWAWSISAALTIGPLWQKSFGEADHSFCWIESGETWSAGSLWRAIFLSVVFLSVIAVAWTHIAIVEHLERAQQSVVLLSAESGNIYTNPLAGQRRSLKQKSPAIEKMSPGVIDTASYLTGEGPSTRPDDVFEPQSQPSQSEASPQPWQEVVSAPKCGTESPTQLSRRNSFFKIFSRKRVANMNDGQRTVGGEGGHSTKCDVCKPRRSSFLFQALRGHRFAPQAHSLYASNSQVSSKDWLWITSRHAGFIQKNGDLDREEEGGDISLVPRNISEALTYRSPLSNALLPFQKAAFRDAAFAGDMGNDNVLLGLSSITPSSSTTGSMGTRNAETSATSMITPERSVSEQYVDGVGIARTFGLSMSSRDMDYTYAGRTAGQLTSNLASGFGGEGRKNAPTTGLIQHTRTKSAAARKWEWSMSTLYSKRRAARSGDMNKLISRVKWYPVIFVFCWIFTLISGIHTLVVGPQNVSFTMVLLATTSCRLQGLVNFFWYGLNDSLKQAWSKDFFYGRAVSSCCYLFWFCCYAPCCLLRNMWVKGGALSDQADSGAHVAASKDTDSDTGKMEEGQDTAETVTMHPPSNITPARPCCKPKMAFKSPQVFRLTPAFPRTRMARLARSVRPTRPNRKVDPKIRGSSFGKRFTAGLAGGRTERPKTRAIVGRTSERGRTDYRRHKTRKRRQPASTPSRVERGNNTARNRADGYENHQKGRKGTKGGGTAVTPALPIVISMPVAARLEAHGSSLSSLTLPSPALPIPALPISALSASRSSSSSSECSLSDTSSSSGGEIDDDDYDSIHGELEARNTASQVKTTAMAPMFSTERTQKMSRSFDD